MKRLKHYLPNYLLTVILVFVIAGGSALTVISKSILSPSFYISSAQKHDIYQKVSDYMEDYFDKSYAVSSIPAEIYMDGLEEETIKKAVDGKINAFFDYVSGKTDSIEETEIDFTELEKNFSDFFDKFAEENNVNVDDSFKKQLDNTIKAAEKDVNSFTNIYMLDYMEKSNILNKLHKVYPWVSYGIIAAAAVGVICILAMIFINRKELKSVLYWLSISGICASLIMLVPFAAVKYTDYFSRLIMRTDYIYYAVTGMLNDSVNMLAIAELGILGASVLLMIIYAIASAVSGMGEKTE